MLEQFFVTRMGTFRFLTFPTGGGWKMVALRCTECLNYESKGAKLKNKFVKSGDNAFSYPLCKKCNMLLIRAQRQNVTPAVGDDGASDVSASAVGDDVTQFTSVISPAAVLTRSSRALTRPVVPVVSATPSLIEYVLVVLCGSV